MKTFFGLWVGIWIALAAMGLEPEDTKNRAKGLNPIVMREWLKADARLLGWLTIEGNEPYFEFVLEKSGPNALPELSLFCEPKSIKRLPVPTVPFALRLINMDGLDLKNLVRLKELRALELFLGKITDQDLVDLPALSQLRYLKMYGIPITDKAQGFQGQGSLSLSSLYVETCPPFLY